MPSSPSSFLVNQWKIYIDVNRFFSWPMNKHPPTTCFLLRGDLIFFYTSILFIFKGKISNNYIKPEWFSNAFRTFNTKFPTRGPKAFIVPSLGFWRPIGIDQQLGARIQVTACNHTYLAMTTLVLFRLYGSWLIISLQKPYCEFVKSSESLRSISLYNRGRFVAPYGIDQIFSVSVKIVFKKFFFCHNPDIVLFLNISLLVRGFAPWSAVVL